MWTKSQKISAAVLGLAATAFAVDRWVLDRPAAAEELAEAAPAAELVVSRPASSSVPSAKTASAPKPAASQTVTLANRLAALGESKFFHQHCGDAFRPSDEWLAVANPPPKETAPAKTATASAAKKPAVKKVDYAAIFRGQHSLNAVMAKQVGGMAIVDGKVYAIGQTIDGFKLTRIGVSDATFTGKGTTVTLRLPGQPSAGAPVADAR